LPVLAPSGRQTTEGETMARPNRSFAVAVFAAAILGVGATGAFAGEVQGPPGSPTNPGPNPTGAPEHSSSVCSFNGLNDFVQGPTEEQTQTPHNQGVPGEAGADAAGSGIPGEPTCGKGSNPRL
jgi:hypothetical protein